MSLIQWNIRGLLSNLEQIRILFKEHDVAAICIQETMLGNVTPNLGNRYAFYRSPPPRGVRAQGGTGIIVSKSINHKVVHIDSVLQACAIQIFSTKWVTLCSLYLEPSLEMRLQDASGNPRHLVLNDLQSLIDQLPQPFILMGDFNAKHRLWGENICDSWGNIIEELLDDNDIIMCNDGSPTRYDIFHNTSSAIDLTICSSSLRPDYQWSVDEDLHGSDHWPIHLKFLKNSPSPCLPKWKSGEADWKAYKDCTKTDQEFAQFSGAATAYDYLVNIMTNGAMMTIPKTGSNPRRALVPWWNEKCALIRKITRASYKRLQRIPILINKIIYKRNLAKQKLTFKESRRESFITYISELKYDSPLILVWNRIRKLMGKFVPSPLPILKINNVLVSDPIEVAEVFGRHFSSISSASHYSQEFRTIRENTVIIPPLNRNSESYNVPFSMNELDNAISLSSPTSPGEDEILYSMISHLPSCAKDFFLNVLNKFWVSGTSAKAWKTSCIVPILKPGKDSSSPKAYRPIALTSCVSKVYERMINARLVWILDSRNLLSNRQFGFRKNKSTIDPLSFITREIQNAFNVQNQTVAVFFDLEKAYDTTWRGGILKQLAEWGIGGNMYYAIKDFLSDRYLKVRVGCSFSSSFLQEEGIPQGSVLSPTLFNIAINGLLEQVPLGAHGLAFADDFAVFCSKSSAVEACRKVQQAIDAATTWAGNTGFKFSSEKTKAIRFTRTRRAEEIPTLFLEGTILPYEDNVKYLGIYFDKKLTFDHHINYVVCEVKKRMNILKVVSNFNWGADRTTLLRLYQSLCLSKIDYGCQIYGSACKTSLAKLDVSQNSSLRICLNPYRTSPVDSLYVDSGFPPLSIRREELGLRYMSRVLTNKSNPNYKFIKEPVDRAPRRPRLPKPLEVRLLTSAREVSIVPPCVEEICPPKYPPWCRPKVKICPTLGNKKESSNNEMKSLFLEHATRHSKAVDIFTDGSKTTDGVGFSVIVPGSSIKRKLSFNFSVFTAELLAILNALIYIFNNPSSKNFVIYTDCLSILSSLKAVYSTNPIINTIHDWLVLLANRKKITIEFCWVPSHVGIDGNEMADAAAKAATRLVNESNHKVPLLDLRKSIRSYCMAKWEHHWSNLPTNLKLKSIRPSISYWRNTCRDRRSSIVLTRLRIGHTYFTHKYLMASGADRQAPLCSTCHVVFTVKHILLECPVFVLSRRANLLVGLSLSDILGENAPIERICKFLKDVNLFYDI